MTNNAWRYSSPADTPAGFAQQGLVEARVGIARDDFELIVIIKEKCTAGIRANALPALAMMLSIRSECKRDVSPTTLLVDSAVAYNRPQNDRTEA